MGWPGRGYLSTMTIDHSQDGVAEALSGLGNETRHLVRAEVEAVRQEMWQKAKQGGPTLALGVAAAVLGVGAGASSYRLSLRVLERIAPPGVAALLATAGYGAGAAWAASAAARRVRQLPAPLPTETARRTAEAAAEEARPLA